MYKPLLLGLLSASALGAQMAETPTIFARQSSCSDGEKTCGAGCIQTTWTCCPDQAGGCDPSQYCVLGNNGEYGCCDNGKTCRGAGGAITSYPPDNTSGGVPQPTSSAAGVPSGGTCSAGKKTCGDGCIPATDTCCPDQQGGCPAGKYCLLASNGVYGCCTNGQTCQGAAGSPTGTGGGAVPTTSSLPGGSSGGTCGVGKKACGDGCIPATDTCCPDQQGGCPVGKYCVLGSNGVYGCCTNGRTCQGAAPTGTGGGATPTVAAGGTCSSSETTCGSGCIPLGDTCCPDQQGGCRPGTYCSQRSDGTYGCCLDGEVCEGAAGAASTSALLNTNSHFTSRLVDTSSSSSPSFSSTSTSRSTRTSTSTSGSSRTLVTTPTSTGGSTVSASTVSVALAAPSVRAELGAPFFAFGGLFAAQALF